MSTTTLYRPIGDDELALVEESGFTAWPPRLPEQPIFYPVTNEGYAIQIARDWNTVGEGKRGHVTRFEVDTEYLSQFDRRIVGGREHEEYWIPAERLDEFNSNIVGRIEVIATFTAADRLAHAVRARS